MTTPVFDQQLLATIANELDLRPPNAEAVETVMFQAARHFSQEGAGPFEGTVDVATAVGKTYAMVGLMDYLIACGYRNFVVICPGRTVARKTIGNFTPGHPKHVPGMSTDPLVVTAENFDSPTVASALTDETVVKVHVFTVQALLTPRGRADRRTQQFQEGLGEAFYEALQNIDDLVVFADESHLYGGQRFARAVSELHPQILIGLTATPKRNERILYRYPLAAAIAEGYVKTPVMAGRRDDRDDFYTKLSDGVRLLDRKRRVIEAYRAEHPEAPVVNPVMLVIAGNIGDANEATGILRHPNFAGGAYRDAILEIHSEVDDVDDALARLDDVENPDSSVRVIVSVGMLKEGWDVRNVYVICSLRASVSEILTEQTLGRGLRLPFGGRLTGVPALDTLEVVVHERYDALIARIDRMREAFVDMRTVTAAAGPEDQPVDAGVAINPEGDATPGTPAVTDVDARIADQDAAAAGMEGEELRVREDLPTIQLPVVPAQVVEAPFSLAEITDMDLFRAAGRRLAAEPDEHLRFTAATGAIETDDQGQRVARMRRQAGGEPVISPAEVVPLEQGLQRLREDILHAGVVPAREQEVRLLRRILDAFVEGLGTSPERSLSAYHRRAAEAIVAVIRQAQQNRQPTVSLGEVELRPFDAVRHGRPTVLDRYSPFSRGVGYTGFAKSLYAQDWFDGGSTEFRLAGLIDDAEDVVCWLRLQTGDLTLPWRGMTRSYNPDFVVVDTAGVHWLLEAKSDDAAQDEDVVAKRQAAAQWVNHVTAETGTEWRYLFVTESDIERARESWPALKQAGLAT
jgi:type III restriction enzyme